MNPEWLKNKNNYNIPLYFDKLKNLDSKEW